MQALHVLNGLYAAHPFWTWMALAAVLLAVEVSTGSGYLLWPAASAAVTGLLAGFGLGPGPELLVFAALTIVSTLLARRFFPHPFQPRGPDINDPAHRIIGHEGQAAGAFIGGHGRVLVDGKEWAAELEGGADLPAGAEVTVTGVVGGARLKVKAG